MSIPRQTFGVTSHFCCVVQPWALWPLHLLGNESRGNINYCDHPSPVSLSASLVASCKAGGGYHSVLGDREKVNGTFREFIVPGKPASHAFRPRSLTITKSIRSTSCGTSASSEACWPESGQRTTIRFEEGLKKASREGSVLVRRQSHLPTAVLEPNSAASQHLCML